MLFISFLAETDHPQGILSFQEKDTAEVPAEIFIPIPSGCHFTTIAKMAFDIMKKTHVLAILGNQASQLVFLSILHSCCGLLGVITCMPTHILCLQTPLPRYNCVLQHHLFKGWISQIYNNAIRQIALQIASMVKIYTKDTNIKHSNYVFCYSVSMCMCLDTITSCCC